jgi:hypothetical protein
MTIETFYETLEFAVEVDIRLRLQASLEAITDTLNNLVTSPAHPQQQSTLASALKTFNAAADELGKTLTPAQAASIAGAGGAEFFDPSIADKVKASVATNAMTPSVARDFVQDLADRRASYLTTIKQTLTGLDTLGVTNQESTPGAANLSFVIPRELFDNELSSFAKELKFIGQLIRNLSEAVTGEPQPVALAALSSSTPTVAVTTSAKVTETIATTVGKFLEAWEKAEKIRRIRQELFEMGLRKQTFDDLTDQITTTVNDVVEESIRSTLSGYLHDPVRRRQLEAALSQDTRRLFGQIERGLSIQFRVRPRSDSDAADRAALDAVDRMSRAMRFPQATGEPMLLTDAQVLEGDFDSVVVPKKIPAPAAPQPATNGTQPVPVAAAVASSGGSSLWGRRRNDRQD